MKVTIFVVLALFGCLAGIGAKPKQPAPPANVQKIVQLAPTNSNVEWLVRTNPPDLEARLNPGREPVQPAPATRPPRSQQTATAPACGAADDRQHRELVKQRERQHRELVKQFDQIKRQQQQVEWYLLRKHGR